MNMRNDEEQGYKVVRVFDDEDLWTGKHTITAEEMQEMNAKVKERMEKNMPRLTKESMVNMMEVVV